MLKKMSHLDTVQLTCPTVIHANEFGVDFIRASVDDRAQFVLLSDVRKKTAQKIKSLKKLFRENEEQALTELLSLIDDPHSKVRLLVARFLGQVLLKQATEPSMHVMYALQHLENDHDSLVRYRVMATFRKFKLAQWKKRLAAQNITFLTIKDLETCKRG